jgi:hypothetical protein
MLCSTMSHHDGLLNVSVHVFLITCRVRVRPLSGLQCLVMLFLSGHSDLC